jgi:MFS family permease
MVATLVTSILLALTGCTASDGSTSETTAQTTPSVALMTPTSPTSTVTSSVDTSVWNSLDGPYSSSGMVLSWLLQCVHGALSSFMTGAGMLIPVTFIVLAREAGPRRLGRVLAVLGISTLLAPICGQVLGGWLIGSYGWQWIYRINLSPWSTRKVMRAVIVVAVEHSSEPTVNHRTAPMNSRLVPNRSDAQPASGITVASPSV